MRPYTICVLAYTRGADRTWIARLSLNNLWHRRRRRCCLIEKFSTKFTVSVFPLCVHFQFRRLKLPSFERSNSTSSIHFVRYTQFLSWWIDITHNDIVLKSLAFPFIYNRPSDYTENGKLVRSSAEYCRPSNLCLRSKRGVKNDI